MTPNKIAQARAMYDGGKHTVQEIADTFGVSRPTVYRYLTDRRSCAASPDGREGVDAFVAKRAPTFPSTRQ